MSFACWADAAVRQFGVGPTCAGEEVDSLTAPVTTLAGQQGGTVLTCGHETKARTGGKARRTPRLPTINTAQEKTPAVLSDEQMRQNYEQAHPKD